MELHGLGMRDGESASYYTCAHSKTDVCAYKGLDLHTHMLTQIQLHLSLTHQTHTHSHTHYKYTQACCKRTPCPTQPVQKWEKRGP